MSENFRGTVTITTVRVLHRAAKKLEVWATAEAGRHGLQSTEFDLVAALGNTDGLRMGDLARAMLTSPANVTRLVKKLESQGLVERQRGRLSDREVVTRLTPKGVEVFEAAYPGMFAFLKEKIGELYSDEELVQLISLVGRLSGEPPLGESQEG